MFARSTGKKLSKLSKGPTATVPPVPDLPPVVEPPRALPGASVVPDTTPIVGREGKATPSLLGGTGVREAVEEPKRKIAALLQRVETNSVVRTENPASPAKVVQQANPEQARTLHAAVVASEGDEVASALYGTSRVDAVASDILPQATTIGGAITSRIFHIGQNIKKTLGISDDLVQLRHSSGGLEFTREELATARANIVNDLKDTEGVTMNDAMSSFADDGARLQISAVFGNADGGFLKAEDGINAVTFSLHRYGVTPEELTVLKRDGTDYVPVKLEDEIGKEGDYVIRLNTAHEYDPTDVTTGLEKQTVRFNWLDRVSPWLDKVFTDPARWLMDAGSMLSPVYTKAASVGVDLSARFEKAMLDVATEFSDGWKKLSKQERAAVDDYFLEANTKELALDITDLKARGFSDQAVETVKAWRRYWDAHYYFENLDVVRSLNKEGYQLFQNALTKLVAKPISKNTNLGGEVNAAGKIKGGEKIFNPASGAGTALSRQEIDNLYANGGTLAKLRRPVVINGDSIEYMMVRNTPTEYLRKVRETDEILNYREGYFQLQYTAPRFVDEITVVNGVEKRRAIAVGADMPAAERFAEGMRQKQNGNRYEVRGDDRAMQRGDDDWWDVNSAGGRIAQRHRGKLLEDSSGMNQLGKEHILNPVESAIRAARSISGRTVMRPMLETAKARFMQQYDRFIDAKEGLKKFPSSISEIGSKGTFTTKELADARTTWRYIHYLENGYINGMDTFVKAVLNSIGETLGKTGLGTPERALAKLAEGQGPVGLMKELTFFAYLGSNPLRQLIIQPHQTVRTWAYNPRGWLTGRTALYASQYLFGKLDPKLLSKEAKEFSDWMDESGLLDSVDKQNLVRGSLYDAANSQSAATRLFGKGATGLRKVGFDAGEVMNLLGHAASVYDLAKRKGLNVADKRVRANMVDETRAISYDMNFAGDMPYNQTSWAAVLQFMQVPHKAFLQATNRKILPFDRFKLVVGDILLWGPPTMIVSDILGGDILPDNPKLREYLVHGLEGVMLNHMFAKLSEDGKSNIDMTGLAPYDMTGWMEFYRAIKSEGLGTLFINSPSGQLFFKDGGRMDEFIKSLSRFMTGFIDEDAPPESFLQVVHQAASISSGYKNLTEALSEWSRANMALTAIRRLDKTGRPMGDELSNPEIIAKAFGFNTESQRDLFKISQMLNRDSKSYKEQVIKDFTAIKMYAKDMYGKEDASPEMINAVTGFALKHFENDPVARKIVAEQMELDMKSPDSLLRLYLRRAEMPNPGKMKDTVRMDKSLSDPEKELILQRIEDAENAPAKLDQMIKEANE
jgi:hypothetical protein